MKIRSMSSYLGFLLMLLYLGSVGCGGTWDYQPPMMYEEVNVDIRDAEALECSRGVATSSWCMREVVLSFMLAGHEKND